MEELIKKVIAEATLLARDVSEGGKLTDHENASPRHRTDSTPSPYLPKVNFEPVVESPIRSGELDEKSLPRKLIADIQSKSKFERDEVDLMLLSANEATTTTFSSHVLAPVLRKFFDILDENKNECVKGGIHLPNPDVDDTISKWHKELLSTSTSLSSVIDLGESLPSVADAEHRLEFNEKCLNFLKDKAESVQAVETVYQWDTQQVDGLWEEFKVAVKEQQEVVTTNRDQLVATLKKLEDEKQLIKEKYQDGAKGLEDQIFDRLEQQEKHLASLEKALQTLSAVRRDIQSFHSVKTELAQLKHAKSEFADQAHHRETQVNGTERQCKTKLETCMHLTDVLAQCELCVHKVATRIKADHHNNRQKIIQMEKKYLMDYYQYYCQQWKEYEARCKVYQDIIKENEHKITKTERSSELARNRMSTLGNDDELKSRVNKYNKKITQLLNDIAVRNDEIGRIKVMQEELNDHARPFLERLHMYQLPCSHPSAPVAPTEQADTTVTTTTTTATTEPITTEPTTTELTTPTPHHTDSPTPPEIKLSPRSSIGGGSEQTVPPPSPLSPPSGGKVSLDKRKLAQVKQLAQQLQTIQMGKSTSKHSSLSTSASAAPDTDEVLSQLNNSLLQLLSTGDTVSSQQSQPQQVVENSSGGAHTASVVSLEELGSTVKSDNDTMSIMGSEFEGVSNVEWDSVSERAKNSNNPPVRPPLLLIDTLPPQESGNGSSGSSPTSKDLKTTTEPLFIDTCEDDCPKQRSRAVGAVSPTTTTTTTTTEPHSSENSQGTELIVDMPEPTTPPRLPIDGEDNHNNTTSSCSSCTSPHSTRQSQSPQSQRSSSNSPKQLALKLARSSSLPDSPGTNSSGSCSTSQRSLLSLTTEDIKLLNAASRKREGVPSLNLTNVVQIIPDDEKEPISPKGGDIGSNHDSTDSFLSTSFFDDDEESLTSGERGFFEESASNLFSARSTTASTNTFSTVPNKLPSTPSHKQPAQNGDKMTSSTTQTSNTPRGGHLAVVSRENSLEVAGNGSVGVGTPNIHIAPITETKITVSCEGGLSDTVQSHSTGSSSNNNSFTSQNQHSDNSERSFVLVEDNKPLPLSNIA